MNSVHGRLTTPLADRLDPQPVTSSSLVYRGRIWDVVSEDVQLGDDNHVTRDFVRHTGAVAVVPMRGAAGAEEVLMIQQYRHPVGTFDWEVPAGLLDKPGEDPRAAASRELREEVDLDASTWHVLVDIFTSPGALSENLRVFLARDVHPAVADGFVREGEEAGMPTGWVPLDDAADAVLDGRVHNGVAVSAILAATVARQRDWETLRRADAPWPEHPAYR
ncbi:NUDIX hydrolase [Flexivirga endophytica]|uniref:NUDIX hydrolase n=1 Tax=Flexivirga endophytica TaxID=1849103 RepID=A0A916T5R8_9MICO|nr:NUDIX hydrolase [Flexivirga endophytica]GGB32743.1 NUDIX hydrolase [Flexivirga endophytica]GHB40727.1 NUDIX hydrolase [Flexivirga endophytica]